MKHIGSRTRTRTTSSGWFDRIWNPTGVDCRRQCCSMFAARTGIMRLDLWPGQRILVGPDDLFDAVVPDNVIRDLYTVMAKRSQHTFKILTHNAYRMEQWYGTWASRQVQEWMAEQDKDWPPDNITLGISTATDEENFDEQVGALIGSPAIHRFVVVPKFSTYHDLTDVGCPGGTYRKEQVRSCGVCSGNDAVCRDGRYNALVEGISEVIICDRELDNVTAMWSDDLAAKCEEHGVTTIRIDR